MPGKETLRSAVPEDGRGPPIIVPGFRRAAAPGRRTGAGSPRAALYDRATRRNDSASSRRYRSWSSTAARRRIRRFNDVTFAFQIRLEVHCASGLHPRGDLTGYGSSDPDAALADLHYRDVAEYAVGCNTSAGWTADEDGRRARRLYRFPSRRRSRARRAE